MLFRSLLVTALLLPFAFGNAVAHDCPHEDATTAAAGPIYVSGGGVWQESNNVAGLQSSAGSCEDDNGRLRTWAADTKLI